MGQTAVRVRGLDRRRFLIGSAAAGAGLATTFTWPNVAAGKQKTMALPAPIASQLSDGSGNPIAPIHIQLPGPPDVTLLFSGTPLFGLNQERTTVGNFKGDTSWGYFLGTASGSDGEEYGLEVDLRVSEGMYQAADGSVASGLFALI